MPVCQIEMFSSRVCELGTRSCNANHSVVDSTFVKTRQAMSQAFRDDPGLFHSYHANVAMLVHDRHGITDKAARDRLASEVLQLIFGLTEQETTPL